MSEYLIPANSKKSMLILSFFRLIDLIVFGIGIVITVTFLFTIPTNKFGNLILMLLPALIGGFLVLPVPNYHNVMTFLGSLIQFYNSRRRYIWKGWCVTSEREK